jgi:Ser/Thr protein kinase RdoA (MazF antagonist)
MSQTQALQKILVEFNIDGQLLALDPIKRGHINQTFVSCWSQASGERRYVHQRINHSIFKDVKGLMSNVEKVCSHLGRLYAGLSQRRALQLVPTRRGNSYLETQEGTYWRTYAYVEGTETFDVCPSVRHAYEAAQALAHFVVDLSALSVSDFCEPIPKFQDARFRYEGLDDAIKNDRASRLASVGPEIEFALAQKAAACVVVDTVKSGAVPCRITHADPKVNNVLFDPLTQQGLGVVDLDTVMPGSLLYDFGDLVRSTAVPSAEDETDLRKVGMSLEYYTALLKGYRESARNLLTKSEIELLPLAPRALALTLGVRFLADHLNGDTYFQVHRPGQNLDRARAQFQIARSMEAQEKMMRAEP